MFGGVAVVTRLSGSESVDLREHISVGPADRRRRRDRGCCVRPKAQKADRGEVKRACRHRGFPLPSVVRLPFGSLAVAGCHDPDTLRGHGGDSRCILRAVASPPACTPAALLLGWCWE